MKETFYLFLLALIAWASAALVLAALLIVVGMGHLVPIAETILLIFTAIAFVAVRSMGD